MPKKFTANRGKGSRAYGIDITELNINLQKQEAHVVCTIVDALDFTTAQHVALIVEPDFSTIMSSVGQAMPLFDQVSKVVWAYLLANEKAEIILGRPATFGEDISDWVTV